MTKDRSKRTNDIWSLHSQKHNGLTDRRLIIDEPKVNNQSLGPSTAPDWSYAPHFDYKEDYSTALAKWIPRVLGIPSNSNLFQDMQMRKEKKTLEYLKILGNGLTPMRIYGNSQ